MPRGWPLTGRAEELSRINELTRRRDGPAGIVLAGVAGVGKTRLARETLIDVLLLHRSMDDADVTAGITAALQVGAVSADVVAVEARRHATESLATCDGGSGADRHHAARAPAHEQRVVSLTQRRLTDPAAVIAELPPDKRPLPRVEVYDQLLTGRSTCAAATTFTKESAS